MSPTPYTSFGGQELGRTTTWADEGKAGTQAAGDLPRRRLKERQELGIGEDSWKREGTVLAYRQKRLINRTAEFKYIRVSHRLVRCLKNDTTASFPLFAISLESVPAIYMWSLFFLQISSRKDDKLSALRRNLNTNLFSRDGEEGLVGGDLHFSWCRPPHMATSNRIKHHPAVSAKAHPSKFESKAGLFTRPSQGVFVILIRGNRTCCPLAPASFKYAAFG